MLNLSLLTVGLLATGVVILLQPLLEPAWNYPFLLGNWILMGSQEWGFITLFAAFWGFLFFSERPDLSTIVGMMMIVIAGFLVISRTRKSG